MKKHTFIIPALLSIVMGLGAAELPTVAVSNFENKTSLPSGRLRGIQDRMTNAIVNTKKFDVVDNSRLNSILEERQKIEIGISKDDKKGGQIAVAGFLVYGTLLNFQIDKKTISTDHFNGQNITCTLELNLRLCDVRTGKILASKIIKANKTATRAVTASTSLSTNFEGAVLDDTIQDVSQKACNILLELAYPMQIIKISGDDIYLNIPEEQTSDNECYYVMKVGEELLDPDTGRSLGRDEKKVALIKIRERRAKYAIATLISGRIDELATGMLIRKAETIAKEEKPDESGARLLRRF